jgi:transposase
VPYSPEFNGIESYWSLVKKIYKKKLHYKLMKNEWLDTKAMAEESLKEVEKAKVQNCAEDGERQILSK